MSTTTVTSKGQITIPIEIRQRLGLIEGERLEVRLEADTVCLRRAQSVIARTAGVFAHSAASSSAEALREAAESAIALEVETRSRPEPA
jgi:AbrB family looped-hinge helix DNA binding protein